MRHICIWNTGKKALVNLALSVSLHLPLGSKIKIDDVHDSGVQWHPILHSLLVLEFSYTQTASCDIQSDTQLAVHWQWDTDWLGGFVPECRKTYGDIFFKVSKTRFFSTGIYWN